MASNPRPKNVTRTIAEVYDQALARARAEDVILLHQLSRGAWYAVSKDPATMGRVYLVDDDGCT